MGASNITGWENCDFRPKSPSVSKTIRDTPIAARTSIGSQEADGSVSVPMTLSDLERRAPLPQRSPTLGFTHVPFVADILTHNGRGVYFWVSNAFHSKRAVFQRSPIWRVLLYLCQHVPLTQKDVQIRHGNTYGKGRFLAGQSRQCICTNASRGLSAIADRISLFCLSPGTVAR